MCTASYQRHTIPQGLVNSHPNPSELSNYFQLPLSIFVLCGASLEGSITSLPWSCCPGSVSLHGHSVCAPEQYASAGSADGTSGPPAGLPESFAKWKFFIIHYTKVSLVLIYNSRVLMLQYTCQQTYVGGGFSYVPLN